MGISGLVNARHSGHAYKILMNLVNEGILDYFDLDGYEMDGAVNAQTDYIDETYDAYVDKDGCLNMAEDYEAPLSEVIPQYGKVFGFDAEYVGA